MVSDHLKTPPRAMQRRHGCSFQLRRLEATTALRGGIIAKSDRNVRLVPAHEAPTVKEELDVIECETCAASRSCSE